METVAEQRPAKKDKRANLRPFQKGVSGNPAGRAPLTPEERLQRRVQARVITDVAAEMRGHAEAAVEALRDVVEKGDPQAVIGASRLILQYAFGNPKDTVDLTVNNGTRLVTPEDIQAAARRLAASRAEDAQTC